MEEPWQRGIGGVALTHDLFGMTGSKRDAANIPAVQNIVKELRQNGGLKMQVGQAAIQGAQGTRVIQQVLSSPARPIRSGSWRLSRR